MKKLGLASVFVGVLVLAGSSLSSFKAADPQRLARTKWEYQALTLDDVAKLAPKNAKDKFSTGLNALGAEGWELVAIETSIVGSSLGGGLGVGSRSTYFFKRPG